MKSARGDGAAPGRRRASTRTWPTSTMTKSLVEGGTFGLAGTMYGQLAATLGASRRRPPTRHDGPRRRVAAPSPAERRHEPGARAADRGPAGAGRLARAGARPDRAPDRRDRPPRARPHQRLSQTLEHEVVEGRKLEERRHGFAAELADALGIDAGESTLSTLAAALPRNEANALLRAGETVIRSIEKLARRSVANRQLLEHELDRHRPGDAHRPPRRPLHLRRHRHLLRVPDRDPGRARLMGVSTFNGINVALRGLIAQQRALDVTTHNIANASTEGYTRQEAVLEAADPISNVSVWGMLFPGQLGQGVTVDSYRRIRDVFNDVAAARRELRPGRRSTCATASCTRISLAIPEPSDNGIQSLVQELLQRLARRRQRARVARRAPVAGAGRPVADVGVQPRLDHVRHHAGERQHRDRRRHRRGELDPHARSPRSTRRSASWCWPERRSTPRRMQIVKAGQAPNDLLDRRDLLLDKLGKLANVSSVTYDDQNRATVVVAGLTVVTPTAGATTITRGPDGRAVHLRRPHRRRAARARGRLREPPERGQRDLVPVAAERARAVAARRGQRRSTRSAPTSSGTAGGLFFDFTSPTGPPGAAGRITMSRGDPRRSDHDRRRRHRPGPGLGHQRQRDGRPAERHHDRRHDLPRLLQRAPVRSRHRHAEHGPLARRAADRGRRPLGSAGGRLRASRSTRR